MDQAFLTFLFSFLTLLSSSMVVIPNPKGTKIDLSGPSTQFKLLDLSGRALFNYSATPPFNRTSSINNPKPPGSINILSLTSPINVATIQVDRAEAGTIINFYTSPSAKEPCFSLSFAMAVYEPTLVPNVARTGTYGNVQILVQPSPGPSTAESFAVTRAEITYADLPYIIL